MLPETKLTDEERLGSPPGLPPAAPAHRPQRQWHDHAGLLAESSEPFEVIDCAPCGFKHIIPIPSEEELEEVYRHEYYTSDKPLYLEQYQEDAEWWNLAYSARFDTFERLLPASRRRILDVGSGPGLFLAHGQQRGWDCLGIEPSLTAAAHSRDLGVNVVTEFLTAQTAAELGTFDVVHASNVLEHLPDPAAMLRLIRQLLSPQGVVCVVVPNDYNPLQLALQRVDRYESWWLAPPHHINYFDFDSLEGLFRRIGFDVEERQTTFPMELFLLMGDNYVGDAVLGRSCHAKRKRLERTLSAAGQSELQRALYNCLAQQGVGREVVLYGR